MTTFQTVRVAAVQATPAILDAERSVAKASQLIGEAAAGGAQLVVLPEAFLSLYPSNAWAREAAGFGGSTSSGSGCGPARSTCPGRRSTRSWSVAASTR